jgi:hypothetical protein
MAEAICLCQPWQSVVTAARIPEEEGRGVSPALLSGGGPAEPAGERRPL